MEFFNNQDNVLNSILALVGVIIGSSSWVVKRAFFAHADEIKKEVQAIRSDVSITSIDVKDSMRRLYSIEKDMSVQKAESSGLFNRMEDIIKTFRSDFERFDGRINNLERDQYIKARSSKRQ